MRSRVHIVFVNFNSTACLIDCISSLPMDLVTSIVVLDNASDQSDRNLLAQHDFTGQPVEVFFASENVGFGAGMNFAIEQLDVRPDDAIWLLNPDMIVKPHALQYLVEALDQNIADIVSPVITTGIEGKSIWFAGGDFDLDRGCTSHRKTLPHSRLGNYSMASFITGAAPMLRLHTWRELGGFRSDLFLYWEDADLSLRATALGLRMAVIHSAETWHKVGGSSSSDGKSSVWYYHMHRNRLIVCGNHRSKRGLVLGPGTTYTLRLLVRAIREREGAWRKLAASVRGISSGLKTQYLPARNVRIVDRPFPSVSQQ